MSVLRNRPSSIFIGNIGDSVYVSEIFLELVVILISSL